MGSYTGYSLVTTDVIPQNEFGYYATSQLFFIDAGGEISVHLRAVDSEVLFADCVLFIEYLG